VGPALHHFRAFKIWVPQTSALRISATVWWFFSTFLPDGNLLNLQDQNVSFPPTRDRPHPQPNGSDLLGRFFLEHDLGVCCITRLGPVTQKQMPSRAQLHAHSNCDKPIAIGAHHTLYYRCVQSKEEFYSSVDEIVQWISTGPLLQPPTAKPRPHLHITTPSYEHDQQSEVSLYSLALHPDAVKYRQIFHKYQSNVLDKRDRRIGWFPELMPKRQKTGAVSANSVYEKPMPKPDLPPVFLHRPLNLNEDGTSITYRKSHEGPNSTYWEQADAEEIERLFTSGTLRPLFVNVMS
jgi:hypothetical protein